MNYIYDIYLNFKKNYIEFYEWNKNDKIKHFKKISTLKISSKNLYNYKNNIIQIKDNKIIKEKIIIFSDSKDAVAILFDKNGINKMKSDLKIEDKEEIINIIETQKEKKINYKLLHKNNNIIFNTRFEIENKRKLLKKINIIFSNKELDKIKYIYMECFNKEEKNINKMINEIKKEIIKQNDNFYKIYDIFKIIKQNN